jgi:hypothetical protein
MDPLESNQENLVLDETQPKRDYQHSWWRIFLIIFTFISFIIACIFNALSSKTSNGIFTQGIGRVSDKNPTEFTPAGWTFSIWGIIYLWQAVWLIYAISRIPRKSNIGYLYIHPNTLHFIVFVFYIINMGLNIGWLLIWDREHFGWAFFVLLLMLITILAPMIITHILLQRNRSIYVGSNRKLDIWFVRLFVHNGLAVYGTWLYLATTLNLIVWICKIYHRESQAITNASTVGLTLVLIGIIVYFVCENFIFYSSMAYTFVPWFVLIFALSGILSKNYNRTNISQRNQSYALALWIICGILFIIRLGLFILRYTKRKIPTIQEP